MNGTLAFLGCVVREVVAVKIQAMDFCGRIQLEKTCQIENVANLLIVDKQSSSFYFLILSSPVFYRVI